MRRSELTVSLAIRCTLCTDLILPTSRLYIHLQLPVRFDKTRNYVFFNNRRHNQLRDLAWSIVKQQEDPAKRTRVRREDAAGLLAHEVRGLVSARAYARA